MSATDSSLSVACTATAIGSPEAPRPSLVMSEAIAPRSACSGSAERYWSPAMSAAASRVENRGESSMATRLVSTIWSLSSKSSHAMSNRSPCWYDDVSPGMPDTAMSRTASRICSSGTPKCRAASVTLTRSWSIR